MMLLQLAVAGSHERSFTLTTHRSSCTADRCLPLQQSRNSSSL